MSNLEKILIGIFLSVLPPFLLFMLFWWAAAGLVLTGIAPISERAIAASALLGLVSGIALDIRYLKSWIPQFYHLDNKYLVALYLFCSLLAVAFFMGLPIGNLALGVLAGIYLGRRGKFTGISGADIVSQARRGSFFTAIVTAGEAFPIGLLALEEKLVLDILQEISALPAAGITGVPGILMVITFVILLGLLQYQLTRWATGWTYRISAGSVHSPH
ncbi:MAG: hypothetical protein OEV06_04125 [Anaerolineae bacterium]|nr:hypothetical protein [Anaerolineae bacterium]